MIYGSVWAFYENCGARSNRKVLCQYCKSQKHRTSIYLIKEKQLQGGINSYLFQFRCVDIKMCSVY